MSVALVRPSTIFKDLLLVNQSQVSCGVSKAWEGGTKVYINGLGHMTKMTATPIYGKNLETSFLEQEVL